MRMRARDKLNVYRSQAVAAPIAPQAFDVRSAVKFAMYRKCWTQKQLAARLGVTQVTISRWLAGAEPRGDKRDQLRALAADVAPEVLR